ncbi:MAG: IS66 family insertion sequence element accessory protein TnpB [Oribacterium sp.]|nr:IS66 family insertion sequence element accessory protein TnpB [Oribacterium sp.]MBO6309947.1 IS66 family insertion sequence element accessory protein TnpB [Oribacterium sp.]
MSDQKSYRTKDEWLMLIQECRRSGMTDIQWCLANGISRHTFNNAIRRLKKSSYAIPSRSRNDMYDLTTSQQDVVKVDIVADTKPPGEYITEAAPHIDNPHKIEVTMGDIHIALSNGADPVLVSKALSLLRTFS